MTSRPLRVSLILIALLFASSCSSGGDDAAAAADELPLDETGLIATFDVGYEVPLDIPEELQNGGTDTPGETQGDEPDAAADRGERVSDDDPPDGLAMSDESGDEDEPTSTTSPSTDAGDVDSEAPDESGTQDAWPDDPQLRDDGLLYVRSPIDDDGAWRSIALLAPDGTVVWSYSNCDDLGCTHDDIIVLDNGNVAVTATSMIGGRLVDNVFELEPVIDDSCASQDWCTGVARRSRLDMAVPDGATGALRLLTVADDYSSWDVALIADGSTSTIPAL